MYFTVDTFVAGAKKIKEDDPNLWSGKPTAWSSKVVELAKNVNWKNAKPSEIFSIFTESDYIINRKNIQAFADVVGGNIGKLIAHHYDTYQKKADVAKSVLFSCHGQEERRVAEAILYAKYINHNSAVSGVEDIIAHLLKFAESEEEIDYLGEVAVVSKMNTKTIAMIAKKLLKKGFHLGWRLERVLGEILPYIEIDILSGKIRLPNKEVFEKIISQNEYFVFSDINMAFSRVENFFAYDYAFKNGIVPSSLPDIISENGHAIEAAGRWFLEKNTDTEKAKRYIAVGISKQTGEDVGLVFAEEFSGNVVSTYDKELIRKLESFGYSFKLEGVNLRVQHKSTTVSPLLPVKSKSAHVFQKANIVVENLNDFWIFYVDEYGNNDQKNAVKKIREEEEEEKKLKDAWDKANGVVGWIEDQREIEQYPLELNQSLGNGYFLHTFSERVDVDDFLLFGIKTSGKRSRGDLKEYVSYRSKLGRFGTIKDTHEKRTCWECGNKFTFWDIKNDNPSAREGFKRRIDMWEDHYCGC